MNKDMQLQAVGDFTPADLETMRHTLAKDATNEQFALFVRTAVASGLNPFLNHIYCIVYGGKLSIQISVEGIVYLAKRVEGYQGIDTQLVHESDVFKARRVRDEQGRDVWEIHEHEIVFPRGKVIGCYSIAYREGFRPVTEFMEVEEVLHHLSGNNAANWKKYFNDFFKKTVTKRSAKRQFGIEVSEDDPAGTDNMPAAYEQPARRDITEEADAAATAAATTKNPAGQPAADEKADRLKKLKADVKERLVKLGKNSQEEVEAYMQEHAKFKHPQSPAVNELVALLKIMDLHIEQQANEEDDLLKGVQ